RTSGKRPWTGQRTGARWWRVEVGTGAAPPVERYTLSTTSWYATRGRKRTHTQAMLGGLVARRRSSPRTCTASPPEQDDAWTGSGTVPDALVKMGSANDVGAPSLPSCRRRARLLTSSSQLLGAAAVVLS